LKGSDDLLWPGWAGRQRSGRTGRSPSPGSARSLRRDLHYARQGTVGKPLLTDQTEQAWCLTVLTNAVITWTMEYYQLAVQDLRAKGRAVPGELLAHISPLAATKPGWRLSRRATIRKAPWPCAGRRSLPNICSIELPCRCLAANTDRSILRVRADRGAAGCLRVGRQNLSTSVAFLVLNDSWKRQTAVSASVIHSRTNCRGPMIRSSASGG
jgi:hypothetical protein